eukprot:3023507-Pleurochrysis_carterae.AAC.1
MLKQGQRSEEEVRGRGRLYEVNHRLEGSVAVVLLVRVRVVRAVDADRREGVDALRLAERLRRLDGAVHLGDRGELIEQRVSAHRHA